MAKIEVGMIVKYSPEWCEPGEETYFHVVKENRQNPVTGEMSRWLIETLGTYMAIPPTDVVEDYMIIPTGVNVKDYVVSPET